MCKPLFWSYIGLVLTLVSAKNNYDELPETVKREARHKWEECCERNVCRNNSCYIVLYRPSGWASVRQRCQSMYPKWPYTIDIFRIHNEADLEKFLSKKQDPFISRKGKLKTFWTSGARCPKTYLNETKLVSRWITTDQAFPAWLEEKINSSSDKGATQSDSCQFLVISRAQNGTDVKYDFQNQNARHSTICEFAIPDVQWTTETESTTLQTTLTQTTTEIKEPASTSKWTTETPRISDTQMEATTERSNEVTVSASTDTPKPRTESMALPSTSTNSPKGCEGVNVSGISWPDTPAGETAREKCPKGMIGFAVWECDEISLKFRPEKPQIEGCKHEWIKHIEDSIWDNEDAVEISTKLAEKTKDNNMSHGDIIALVNLTTNLFRLYTEQKREEEFEVSLNEEMPVYVNFTKTMISSISNILRIEIKDAWEELNENRQTKEASTILRLVTTIGSRLSCIKTSTEKLQISVSEENIDLQTFILNNTNENSDVIIFPQQTESVKSNNSISLPADLKLDKWYSPCRTYSSAVGVMYKRVGDFLKAGQQNSTIKVATEVLSFSVSNTTESIPLSEGKVNITLQHLPTEDEQDEISKNPRCVFWNFSKSEFGEWDESGCHRLSFNDTHTVCQCSHLTNFAVLMDINDNVDNNEILTLMTYVCCGLSSISLFLTLLCLSVIKSLHGRRSIITGNLCFSLLITNGLIIFGLSQTQNRVLCGVIAGVLHFFILSAFCWMLVEGYHLYRMVILVFQRGSNLPVKFYYLFAYGAPLIVVAISAGIRFEGYGRKKYCWLSPDDKGLMWSFVGPACAILLVNLIIFILTLRSASSVKIKKEQTKVKKIKSWMRGSFSVMCLLGLTWCLGLFYSNKKLKDFSYIFTVLNGLQGVFIFLFHIVLNDKVINFFSWKENKYGRKKYLNHTSSNQTQSKTSTRTSSNSIGCTSSTRIPETRNVSISQLSRRTTTSSGNSESEAAKYCKKKKVTHAMSSNGLRQTTQYPDSNVRIRSSSASTPNSHPQVLQHQF